MTELIPLYFYSQIGGYDHKIVGIENFGNSCFANSFLQTLYSSKNIRQQIINFSDQSLPTDDEFRSLFKGKLLHQNIASYIELNIKQSNIYDNDPDVNHFKIVAKFNDLDGNILDVSSLTKFKIEYNLGYTTRSFNIQDISTTVNDGDIQYTFIVKKESGRTWNNKIYLNYTDYFNMAEIVSRDDYPDLIQKLEWFSTDSIKKGDILEIMRFKYLKQLFILLNDSSNNTVLRQGQIINTIKGIVATVVSKYSNSGGVDQSDSGEILLKIISVLEKVFHRNNLLKVNELNEYLIKKPSGEVVIKTIISERDPDSIDNVNMVPVAYDCPKEECVLKEIFPIYLNNQDYEISINTDINISNLLHQNDDNWGRLKFDELDDVRDSVNLDEELYCVINNNEVRGTEPNEWGFFPMVNEHKCAFHPKSDLVNKEFYCINSKQILTPLTAENVPNFLIFYNARTNADGSYNNKKIIFNLYEIFFGKHYMLTGVTIHSGGGTSGGHYISKVRHNDNNYYYISDSRTELISWQGMLDDTRRWSLLIYEEIPNLNQNIIRCNQ